MDNFYTGNRYLTTDEMGVNARYIYSYLTSRGWSLNAISAMLGNMQTESSINPGIWQNLDEGNTSLGFGLVQWTPATKYLDWCSSLGLEPSHMDSALQRIEYEVENGAQWIATSTYNFSFATFKTSTESPAYLADAFLKCYERPLEQTQPARGTQAEYWYTYISGANPTPTPTPTPGTKKRKSLPLIMKYIATKRV